MLRVGDVAVGVSPDLSGFARELSAGIAASMARVGDVEVDVKTDTSGLNNLTREASRASQKVTRSMGDVTRAVTSTSTSTKALGGSIREFAVTTNGKLVPGLDSAAKLMAGFGAATAVAAGLSAKAAVDWESAWAGVVKTASTDAPDALAKLEGELRGLARQLPATHREIAAVGAAAGQLGVQAPAVAEFSRTMIDLGETTNLNADQAATSIARFANIMDSQLGPQYDRIGSTIVDLGNNFATTEAEITEMATRMASAGRQIGLSEADILAFSTALSSVGVRAEAGGTAISKVMLTVQNAVMDGSEDLETFADVAGMTADQFAAAFRDDAADAILSFTEGLREAQDSGANTNAILEDVGLSGIRVGNALRATAGAGDLVRNALDQAGSAWQENTALTEEAELRYQTTAAQLEILRNNVVDLAIDLGDSLLPVIRGFADAAGAMLDGFRALPEPVQSGIAQFTLLAGAVAGVGGAALLILPQIGKAVAALRALGAVSAAAKLDAFASTLVGAGAKFVSFAARAGIVAAAVGGLGRAIVNLTGVADQGDLDQTADHLERLVRVGTDAGILRAADGVEGYARSLDQLADPSLWQNIQSGVSRFLGAIGSQIPFLRLQGTVRDMEDELRAADDALAQMVESGNAGQAARAFQMLADRATEAGVPLQDIRGYFEQYRTAVINNTDSIYQNIDAQRQASGTVDTLAQKQLAAQQETERLSAEMEAAEESQRRWADAIDTAVGSLGTLTSRGGGYSAFLEELNASGREWAEQQAASTADAEDSWDDYFTEVAQSSATLIESLNDQTADIASYTTNLQAIHEAGFGELADFLHTQFGPEYATAIADIAEGGATEMAKAQEAYRDNTEAALRAAVTAAEIAGQDFINEHGNVADDAVAALTESLGVAPGVAEQAIRDMTDATEQRKTMFAAAFDTAGVEASDALIARLAEGTSQIAPTVEAYKTATDREAPGLEALYGTMGADAQAAMIWALGKDATGNINRTVENYRTALNNRKRRLVDAFHTAGLEAKTAIINILATGTGDISKTVRGYGAALKLGIDPLVLHYDRLKRQATQLADGAILTYASGGIRDVERYANGGERHVAQIAPAGAWRLWAEPETGGEAYIPLAPSKRPRSRAIWEETGRRLGVEGFAEGGIRTFQRGGFDSLEGIPEPIPIKVWSDLLADPGRGAMGAAYQIARSIVEGGSLATQPSSGFGGVKPHVARSGHLVNKLFGPLTIGGVAYRRNRSDHPLGLALDFMTYSNVSLGNRIVAFLQRNWAEHRLKYLIWRQRIATSPGAWRGMADRGSPTANHMDHPHASYLAAAFGGIIDRMASGGIRGSDGAFNGAASFDSGGWLQPGWTLARNATGRPEAVMPMQSGGILGFDVDTADVRAALSAIGLHFGQRADAADVLRAKARLDLNVGAQLDPSDVDRIVATVRERYETAFAGAEMRERVAENRREWLFSRETAERQLAILDRRIAGQRTFTDEWVQLTQQRNDVAAEAADEAARRTEQELDRLNGLLDEHDRVGRQITEARGRYRDQLADAEEDQTERIEAAEQRYAEAVEEARGRARDAIRDVIDARRTELDQTWGPTQRPDDDALGQSVGQLIYNLDRQRDAFLDWETSLATLRNRGVDEAVIDALGLGDSPEAIAQIRQLLQASDDDLLRLSQAYLDRQSTVNRLARQEQSQAESDLWDAIQQRRRDGQAELRQLERDHAATVEQLRDDHRRRMDQIEQDWNEQLRGLQEERAAIGEETGRTYTQAIADAMRSGIPAIVDAAEDVQKAMRGEKAAAAQTAGDRLPYNTAEVRDALRRLKVGFGDVVNEADVRAGFNKIGRSYGTTIDPADIARLVAAAGNINLNARVYVGNREITDIVKVEIDREDEAAARNYLAGSRR